MSGQVRPGQVRSGQARSGQVRDHRVQRVRRHAADEADTSAAWRLASDDASSTQSSAGRLDMVLGEAVRDSPRVNGLRPAAVETAVGPL